MYESGDDDDSLYACRGTDAAGGDTIRCWLPLSAGRLPRQTGVELISAWPERYVVARRELHQRSICFLRPVVTAHATVSGSHVPVTTRAPFDPEEVINGSNRTMIPLSEVYRKYTAQRRRTSFSATDRTEGPQSWPAARPSSADRFARLRWSDGIVGRAISTAVPNIPKYVLDADTAAADR